MFNIIVPVSKNHKFVLMDALKSIEKQNVDDFFVIVIGDGFSPKDVVPEKYLLDKRFSFHWTYPEENKWGTKARNFGLEKIDSQRKYICYLDADNLWLPNHLNVCEKEMLNCDLFCSAFYALDPLGNCVGITSNKNELGRIDTNGMCINLDKVDKVDIVWKPFYGHDFEIFHRLSEKYVYKIGSEPTFIYRCSNRIITDFIRYGVENNGI